jgi:hypothetical protein
MKLSAAALVGLAHGVDGALPVAFAFLRGGEREEERLVFGELLERAVEQRNGLGGAALALVEAPQRIQNIGGGSGLERSEEHAFGLLDASSAFQGPGAGGDQTGEAGALLGELREGLQRGFVLPEGRLAHRLVEARFEDDLSGVRPDGVVGLDGFGPVAHPLVNQACVEVEARFFELLSRGVEHGGRVGEPVHGEVREGDLDDGLRIAAEGEEEIEVRAGLAGLVEAEREASGGEEDLAVLRITFDGAAPGLEGLLGTAGGFVDAGERGPGLDITRIALDGAGEEPFGAYGVSTFGEGEAEATEPDGLSGERAAEVFDDLDGLVDLPLVEPELGEHEVRVGVGGAQLDGAGEVGARAGRLLRLVEDAAHEELRGGVVGALVDDALELGFGALELREAGVLLAHLGEEVRVPVVAGEGEPELIERAAVVGLVMLEPRPEEVRVRRRARVRRERIRHGAGAHGLLHGLEIDGRTFRRASKGGQGKEAEAQRRANH